jgi:hypothetical protein
MSKQADILPPRWFSMRHVAENQALIHSDARFTWTVAGRRAYKSESAKRKLILAQAEDLKPWRDRRYFYAAPTRAQAKKLAWEDLLALIPPAWIGDPRHDILWQDLTIKTLFGSRIEVIGLDEPQRVEGVGYDGGVVDEMSDVKPRALKTSVWPTLSDRDGWCWHMGVPKRFGVGATFFRERWQEARDGQVPNSAAFWWVSGDVLTTEQLDFFREQYDPVDFEEQFNARWQSPTGRIFHAFDRTPMEGNVRPCAFHPDLPLIVGCDFNVNPMAWTLSHVHEQNGSRIIETFDELWMRDCNTPKALDALWQGYGERARAGIRFYGDATGRARKTSAAASDYQHIATDSRFRGAGATIHFPRHNPPTADRFAACNAMLCNGVGHRRAFIDERCKHLTADLEYYAYKDGTREPDSKDRDAGHMADAWGYAINVMFPLGSERPRGRTSIHISTPERRAKRAG